MPSPTGPVRWPPLVRWLPMLAPLAACSDIDIRTLVPEIAVSPPALDFGDAAARVSHTEEVFVTNAGNGPLEITSVRFEPRDPAFELVLPEGDPIVVESDATLAIPVVFTPETFLPYATELVIESNDAERPEVRVPVTGVGVYASLPEIVSCGNPIDFGFVSPGGISGPFTCVISNEGDATLDLSSVTITGESAGEFSLLADPSGAQVARDESYPIVLTYSPDSTDGDQAVLQIASNAPGNDAVLDITLIGNGGIDFEYPVAVIDCPASAAPPEYVTLDGSESYDPSGTGIIAWQWNLVSRPAGSQASFTAADAPVNQVFADSAGAYTVMLQVVNGAGVLSLPTLCSFDAIPADALHVELTWDGLSSDIDLHLRQDGFAVFDTPEDTSYCNPFPEWGAAGTDDNPRLDLDDRAGKGPENINILAPADGTYDIAVHYFDDDYDGLVTATVRVYIFGVLVHEELKLLDELDLWEVGSVTWPDATFTPDGTVLLQKTKGCN